MLCLSRSVSVLSLFIFLLFSIGNPNQFVISDDDSCPFFRLFIMEEYSFGRQNQKKTNFYYHQMKFCFVSFSLHGVIHIIRISIFRFFFHSGFRILCDSPDSPESRDNYVFLCTLRYYRYLAHRYYRFFEIINKIQKILKNFCFNSDFPDD